MTNLILIFFNRNPQNSDLLYNSFVDILTIILNKHAPLKENVVRGNQASFMEKGLREAIMTRPRLKSNYNKNPTPET